jgi:hypothetical protein
MTKEELTEKLTGTLRLLAPEDRWPISFENLETLIDSIISEWYNDVDSKIVDHLKDWENRMPDDKTLYTLGIRRVLDLIRGEIDDLDSLKS